MQLDTVLQLEFLAVWGVSEFHLEYTHPSCLRGGSGWARWLSCPWWCLSLLLRGEPITSGWPDSSFVDVICFFSFASISILNHLSQTNHPFDRLIAHGLILKNEVQLGKTWLMQVQRAYRAKFTTLISGEEVSLVFSGERQQKEKSTWT